MIHKQKLLHTIVADPNIKCPVCNGSLESTDCNEDIFDDIYMPYACNTCKNEFNIIIEKSETMIKIEDRSTYDAN